MVKKKKVRRRPKSPIKAKWAQVFGRIKNPPPANVAAAEIMRVHRKYGELQTQQLVDESRPKDAVFHGSFEWNNVKAANEFRKQQARQIINSLEITIVYDGEEHDAPFAVAFRIESGAESGYTPMEIVMNDERKIEQWLAQGKQELDSWVRRYGIHTQFAKVVRAIKRHQ